MDPKKFFADERHAAFCVFCGDAPTTREHVVSKIFLDEPFPDNLPLVQSCHACNNGYSIDEEYLACLVDCVIGGSTDAKSTSRGKVRASLQHSPALAARISIGRVEEGGDRIIWKPEQEEFVEWF